MKIESINFIQRIFNQGIKLDDNSLADNSLDKSSS